MRLVLIATSANQSYIFASNRLREAVGASELVRLSTTIWVHEAITASGPGRADVVQESSGATLLVMDGGADRARRVVSELTRRAMRDAPGLDVAGAWVPIDGPVPTPTNIDAVFQAHGDMIARRVSTLGRYQRLPGAAACASTDRPATTWRSNAARAPDSGAPQDDDEKPRPVSAEVIAKWRNRWDADRRMGTQAGVRLVDIDNFFDQVERVAVIHADGNGLGAVFRQAAERLGSTDKIRELSKQVQDAADQALRHAATELRERVRGTDKSERRCPLVPLIVGGDDLTVLVDGRFAVAFVRDYLERFGERTSTELVKTASGRECLTASAGIAIVTPHFPFSAAYGLAEELCASAKVPTRNNPAIHAVDVHIQLDSLACGLESIRDRYQANGAVLHERPFLLPAPGQTLPADDAHRGLDRLIERIKAVHSLTADRADGRVVSRTQLHALREELRTDTGRAQRRFTDLWRRAQSSAEDRKVLAALAGHLSDPPTLLRPTTGTTPLVDALEIAAITPDGAL